MTDEDWLALHARVPRSITYDETKRLFSNLGELRIENAGSSGSRPSLYDARLSIEIVGHPANIEFNCRGKSQSECLLYTFFFQIWNIDSLTAEGLYYRVKEYYTDLYGPCHHEQETFEYFYEGCYWDVGATTYDLVKNVYAFDKAYVGW